MIPNPESFPALRQLLARCTTVVRSHPLPLDDDSAAMNVWESEGGSTGPLPAAMAERPR
jgi:hypothetical protein